MLALTSCVKEGEVEAPQEMATAVYNVAFYDYEIKSLGDASDINYIWYAVYNEDGEYVVLRVDVDDATNEEYYSTIDDDDEFDAVVAAFNEDLNGEYDLQN